MTKYFLFSYYSHEALGGAHDLVGIFDTPAEAEAERAPEWNRRSQIAVVQNNKFVAVAVRSDMGDWTAPYPNLHLPPTYPADPLDSDARLLRRFHFNRFDAIAVTPRLIESMRLNRLEFEIDSTSKRQVVYIVGIHYENPSFATLAAEPNYTSTQWPGIDPTVLSRIGDLAVATNHNDA